MKALRNTFILILALAALPVMAQSKYAYLHQTANELLQIQRSSMKMSAADTTGISTRVCKTLERLRKDKNFKKDVEDLAGASRNQSAFHRRLADDLMYFLDSFAIEESEVLEKAGLSSKSAGDTRGRSSRTISEATPKSKWPTGRRHSWRAAPKLGWSR